jgi:hypothetical protein
VHIELVHRGKGPTWTERLAASEAAAAVARLDGEEVSQMTVEGPRETQLLVGGGPALFTVLAVVGPDDFLDLVANPTADGDTDLLIGGQSSPWPLRLCASREQVVEAVIAWVSDGRPNPNQSWQKQGPTLA